MGYLSKLVNLSDDSACLWRFVVLRWAICRSGLCVEVGMCQRGLCVDVGYLSRWVSSLICRGGLYVRDSMWVVCRCRYSVSMWFKFRCRLPVAIGCVEMGYLSRRVVCRCGLSIVS